MPSQLSPEEVLEVMTEAETEVMCPQSEVPWKLEEARKDTALQPPEGMQTCGRLDSSPTKPILDSVLQNAKTINV